MKLFESFLHFLTPRHTNNHKAKALHFSSISTYIGLLLIIQIIFTVLTRISPQVLGYASNINVNDLLNYTNQERSSAGLSTLTLNDQLSQAAQNKANDMFANNYWAHNSPSGKDPWSFIVAAGYSYLFAGENLARDFGDSQAVVNAWMNSPSHRENLLNNRYREIGFAVVNGKLNGNETTLVVQMFGTKPGGAPTVSIPAATAPVAQVNPQTTPTTATVPAPQPTVTPQPTFPAPSPAGTILNIETSPTPVIQPKFDVLALTRNLSIGLVLALLVVMVIDSALVYRRRIVRLSGHNLAHLMILLAVLVALNTITRGTVL